MGDIICFSGITDITIGNTICDLADVSPLPFVKISEPTVEMTFSVNNSPFAGREGKFVTSRQLRDRLFKELLKDVSLGWRRPIPPTASGSAAGARCTFHPNRNHAPGRL